MSRSYYGGSGSNIQKGFEGAGGINDKLLVTLNDQNFWNLACVMKVYRVVELFEMKNM